MRSDNPIGTDNSADEEEWLRLTPAERLMESSRLWALYLALGGSLDPEPDPQSPFYDPEAPCPSPPHRRTGVHYLRRS
jgi:hypothetical protein